MVQLALRAPRVCLAYRALLAQRGLLVFREKSVRLVRLACLASLALLACLALPVSLGRQAQPGYLESWERQALQGLVGRQGQRVFLERQAALERLVLRALQEPRGKQAVRGQLVPLEYLALRARQALAGSLESADLPALLALQESVARSVRQALQERPVRPVL